MRLTARRWLLLALVALMALGLLYWPSATTTVPTEPALLPQPLPAPEVGEVKAPVSAEPTLRSPAEPPALDEPSARERYGQGLRGQAVDEQGRSLADVAVYLIESPVNDPLALPAMLRLGLTIGPTASTKTDADGTFALGLQVATDRLYEVHLLAEPFADTRITGLRILPGQWHDLGAQTMQRGAVVRGRVTVEGSELPVPHASVTLLVGSAFDDTLLRALPGREQGQVALCDAAGYYELRNAPTRGSLQLLALAPGFTSVLRQDLTLLIDVPTQVDFGLRPGHSLGGVLFATDGRPVTGARVEAWPMQGPGHALSAISRADGSFAVHGLPAGPHRLRVAAREYQPLEWTDLLPTRMDLRIELRARATLAVAVHDANGQPLRQFHLALRRWQPGRGEADPQQPWRGVLAPCPEVPDQRLRLDDGKEQVEVPGVGPGTYVCQIQAEGYAATLSSPFTIEPTTTRWSLLVTATEGVTLRGVVTDSAGRAVAGATVSSQPAGSAPDNPMWRLLSSATPESITRANTKSANDGTFALTRMALGRYDLAVDHPAYCREVLQSLAAEAPGEFQVPPIRLPEGAMVRGMVTSAGKVLGQVRVVLTSVSAPQSSSALRLETITDTSGAFVLPRRIPPGKYEVRGLALAGGGADTTTLEQLQQMQRSTTPLQVPPGMDEVRCDLILPKR